MPLSVYPLSVSLAVGSQNRPRTGRTNLASSPQPQLPASRPNEVDSNCSPWSWLHTHPPASLPGIFLRSRCVVLGPVHPPRGERRESCGHQMCAAGALSSPPIACTSSSPPAPQRLLRVSPASTCYPFHNLQMPLKICHAIGSITAKHRRHRLRQPVDNGWLVLLHKKQNCCVSQSSDLCPAVWHLVHDNFLVTGGRGGGCVGHVCRRGSGDVHRRWASTLAALGLASQAEQRSYPRR